MPTLFLIIGIVVAPELTLGIVLIGMDHQWLAILAFVLMLCRNSEAGGKVIEKVRVVDRIVYRPAKLSREEAYEILGVKAGAGREVIHARWRTLMARVHPDHGGTNYLASRVNEAKDLLLGGRRS